MLYDRGTSMLWCVWRSQSNLGCLSSSPTLFETVSLTVCHLHSGLTDLHLGIPLSPLPISVRHYRCIRLHLASHSFRGLELRSSCLPSKCLIHQVISSTIFNNNLASWLLGFKKKKKHTSSGTTTHHYYFSYYYQIPGKKQL